MEGLGVRGGGWGSWGGVRDPTNTTELVGGGGGTFW